MHSSRVYLYANSTYTMTNLTRLVQEARGLITLSGVCYQTVAKLLPSVASAGWRRTKYARIDPG
jgi:hypothetical protein